MTNRWRWRWRWACWSQKNKSFVCIVESIGTRAEAGRSETRAHLIYIYVCSCAHVGFGPSPNPFLKTKSETIRCVRVGKTKLTSLCSHFNNIKLQYVVYQTHTHTQRERIPKFEANPKDSIAHSLPRRARARAHRIRPLEINEDVCDVCLFNADELPASLGFLGFCIRI